MRRREEVLTRDQLTGDLSCRPVVHPYSNPDRAIIELTLLDEDGDFEVLETTDNHPFFVLGRGWTRVDELEIGDLVPSPDGQLEVVGLVWTGELETVYNFGVEEHRSYFVGELGAWVHNCFVDKRLRTRFAKILSWSRSPGGNTGISGVFTPTDAREMGEAFVGEGAQEIVRGKQRMLISEDGLRMYRFPTNKNGVHPVSGQPYSSTGIQSNFQSRDIPEGRWINNVHIDIKLDE